MFSTVYDQFTYEVNRIHGTSASATANQFSPKQVYNAFNGGSPDQGTNQYSAYGYLFEHGCLSWADFPYDSNYTALPSSLPLLSRALNTRLKGGADSCYYTLSIPQAGTAISSSTDPELDVIKRELDMGNIFSVTVPTIADEATGESAWTIRTGSNGESFICRTAECDISHALTVVGYNDSVWCDLNGNGRKDPGESGAFKAANSWGNGWGNDGFIWILYDAMNEVSAVPNWESQYVKKRTPVFSEGTKNWFYGIEAEDKDVYFVADVVLNNVNREDISLETIGRRSVRNASAYQDRELNYNAACLTGNNPYTGHMLFDYGDFCKPFAMYKSNYQWEIHPNFNNTAPLSCNITDSCGNVVQTCTKSVSNYVAAISLTKGDVNYDGKVNTTDGSLVLGYATGSKTPSNIQYYLADYNGDGVVDTTDARLIMQAAV